MKRNQPPHRVRLLPVLAAVGALYGLTRAPAQASSHREAPAITTTPKVDGPTSTCSTATRRAARTRRPATSRCSPTTSRSRTRYGGPNYFKLDPNALYEIHIDNTGDGKEDITFQFRFNNTLKGTALPIGGTNVTIPLTQSGQVGAPRTPANLNVNESVHPRRRPRRSPHRHARPDHHHDGGGTTFAKPSDNIGTKTIPNYAAYATSSSTRQHPRLHDAGKVFVGQRKEPFAVNLGVIFDLFNVPGAADFTPAEAAFLLDPTDEGRGHRQPQTRTSRTLALEVPTTCLRRRRRRPGDRRLDHGQPAPGPAAEQRAEERLRHVDPSPAAPGRRFRASACRWSTRS